MAEHLYLRAVIALVLIAALEVWRRKLRHRSPRWVHGVAVALMVGSIALAVYAQWAFRTGDAASRSADIRDMKVPEELSRALDASAASVLAALVAAVVLAVASWRARKIPSGGPVAQARR